MNHSIHTLSAAAAAAAAANHSPDSSKSHPMHQQLHHTLQHHQQQPLVSSANASQQTMLQFHHPTLQHPYSTMHHLQSLHQQQQHSSNNNNNNTMHFATTASQQNLNQHHHQQQQQQHQQQQQQQYNMNSDYSSSTYHIYDQISDLIIIKQQRMEKKRQEERRRKIYLIILAGILLVGTFLFLIMQSLFSTTTTTLQQPSLSNGNPTNDPASLSISNDNNNNNLKFTDINPPQMDIVPSRPTWAPPFGSKQNDRFDSRFQPPIGVIRIPNDKTTITNNNRVISPEQAVDYCSGHGTVISTTTTTPINPLDIQQQLRPQQTLLCKCDYGYWGERCESSAIFGATNNQLLTRCLLTNCNGNGQCNNQGRCQCFPGYFGLNCEYSGGGSRMPSTLSPMPSQQQQQQQQQPQASIIKPPSFNTPSLSSSGVASTSITTTLTTNNNCLNNCNGNGQCSQLNGKCKCYAGFIGDYCQDRDFCFEQNCSNQGICQQTTGECQCKFGFKGQACEIRDDELWQRLFNCSNHGKFDYNLRKCNCDQGYAGFDCSEERCDNLNNNGAEQQPVDCGQNGLFDCRNNKCICQDGYSGEQCQIQQCSPQCLRNGQCVDGMCVCQPGYYGKHCSLNGCPNQCSGKGQCIRIMSSSSSSPSSTNETPSISSPLSSIQPEWRCQCQPGSMGDDCGLPVERQCDDGIDNDRDGLVDCADSECCSDKVCQNSTLCMKSPDPLDILLRKQPQPPTSSFFQRMQFLIEKFSSQIYSNPKDFNDSIAAYRYVDRASVIRGRVTYLKQGLTGVRVSVAGQINLGMTLTRDGGYFDLMVNGGGAVVIEFRREPFSTHQKTVRVPWNEIVLIDNIELTLNSPTSESLQQQQKQPESPLPDPENPSCSAHNYKLMRPVIVPAPKSSRRSHSSTRSKPSTTNSQQQQQTISRAVILRYSGMVQQSIMLPGSSSRDVNSNDANQSVSLIYISSRANEFMSTINLQLTPPANDQLNFKLPQELKLIHLKIIIEGNLFEQLFEPQLNLTYTYAWNRRNVYRQKSFGLSTASVSIGYEYFDCKHVIWTTKHIQLPGHDLSISDIGNQWNFDIHHRYNYRDSILQRGDGQNFNLKTDKPKVVQAIMGDGYQRQATCPYCDGATTPAEQRLLKPQALVSAPDGSIYVGDFNLIRKIEPLQPPTNGASSSSSSSSRQSGERVVRTLLELPTTRVPSKYSLALNLADNKLYMSDIDRHQIYLIREQGSNNKQQQPQQQIVDSQANDTLSSSNSEENLVTIVGSGIECQLDDRSNCGDGSSARLAKLIEPKAITFDLNNRMYIADGPNIRMVDNDGKIYTLLGDYGMTRHTKFPCSGEAIPMHKFVPRSPIDLAFNPIDDTLHILDDNVVYKITQDKRVQIVAGRLSHCLSSTSSSETNSNHHHHHQHQKRQQPRATEVFLQSAQSITFNQNGDLFIGEDDQKQMISRVLCVSPNEDTISLYAGLPIEQTTTSTGSSSSSSKSSSSSTGYLIPTVDSVHLDSVVQDLEAQDKQRSSNILPLSQTTRAIDYKFNSISAITIDQQGKLIIADKLQLRILSIEPDLPQINAAGEYELQSPDNGDELLVFNRYGHHIATREISSGQTQRNSNKYTFTYNVNTSFGQLASVTYSTGNKISIFRDGAHHSVKMIETAFGGQCKLDISRNGQVHSITTITPNSTKTNFSYHVDGGLLKQSRDQASGELFDFTYDEFGRAISIQHSSPKLPAPVECRVSSINNNNNNSRSYLSKHCSELIVAE